MQFTASLTALSALLLVLSNPTYVSAIPLGQRNVENSNDSNSTLVLSSANGKLSARATPPPPPPPIRLPVLPLPNQNAHDLTDKGYVALLKLGDRQKSFKALLDTGSADFWVPSETSTTLGGHSGIGPASSHTLHISSTPFTIGYEDGSGVTGRVSSDTLTVGRISVPQVPVGVANVVQGNMLGSRADGILGLATSRKSRMGQHTVVETLSGRGAIPGLLFGLKLPRLADRNAGELSLGAPNFAKFDTNSQAASINTRTDGLYGIRVARLTVNNAPIPITSAILDSGAEAITAPPGAGGLFNSAIPNAIVHPQPDGTTLSIIPCSDPRTLASVILVTIQGKTFQIQARDLVGSYLQDIQGVHYCLSLVQDSRARSHGEWLFGIPFLKNVYSIFDEARNTVTVARLL
ncbi:acid protease [Dentipellis sp. KUC8613]|nr:acid protease [Dentipellis sp. KUC8613]